MSRAAVSRFCDDAAFWKSGGLHHESAAQVAAQGVFRVDAKRGTPIVWWERVHQAQFGGIAFSE